MNTGRAYRMAVALYPRRWRERYGGELEDLLTEYPLTAWTLLDVVRGAAVAHVRDRTLFAVWLAAIGASAAALGLALLTGATRNIVWAPTNGYRALMLLGTVVPVSFATARTGRARRLGTV